NPPDDGRYNDGRYDDYPRDYPRDGVGCDRSVSMMTAATIATHPMTVDITTVGTTTIPETIPEMGTIDPEEDDSEPNRQLSVLLWEKMKAGIDTVLLVCLSP
ncbi:MAG: hypothetical protein AAGL17_18925, partial [Cyanobacteria bacterium J06576_12]